MSDEFEDLIEGAKKKLDKIGIHIEDVYYSIDPREQQVWFAGVYVDLENKELQRLLADLSASWKNVFNAVSVLKLMGEKVSLSDYVWVEEIRWDKGPIVELFVSDDLPVEELGYEDTDAECMKETLEDLLDYEAKKLCEKLADRFFSLLRDEGET